MMDFSVNVKSTRRRWLAEGGDKGEFNELVKKSLLKSAWTFVTVLLPRRFMASWQDALGFNPRRPKYNAWKRAAKTIFIRPGVNHPMAGIRVQNPNYHKPPDPNVLTGVEKAFVTNKPVEMYLSNARFTYLGKNPTIKVPIPLPHPINPAHAGELTRMIAEEKDMLRGVANAELAKLVDESGFITYSEQIA